MNRHSDGPGSGSTASADPGKRAQKFSFGYQTITWDLRGYDVGDALRLLGGLGFEWFEALLDDTLGADYARRHLTLGAVGAPRTVADYQMFDRLAFFAHAGDVYGVRPLALYIDGELLNPTLWPHEFAKVKIVTRLLAGMAAPLLVCGGGPGGGNHSRDDYRSFCLRLKEIGQYAAEFGVQVVYHPHLDTFVETRGELDRLMDELDTDCVSLCIDPAHFQVNGDDPVDIFATYATVINHVHLKDWRHVGNGSGHDRYRGFCELGMGVVDLEGITNALIKSGYAKIVVVELDYSSDPDASARHNADYIQKALGLKLTVE